MKTTAHLIPLDEIEGYKVRPGFYEINGATAIQVGVNFTIHSHHATACELLLFRRYEEDPYAVIPFPENYRIGNVFSMIIFDLNIDEFEYAYRFDGPYEPEKGIIFNKNNIILDPYAKAVTGQKDWGQKPDQGSHYKARVVKDDFDWGNIKQPLTPVEDLIIYEMHVRGFTKDESSGVSFPGTFKGIEEKISHLKELGITAVELMPIFEFDELRDRREHEDEVLLDYWGYNPVSFFAPNTSYASKVEHNKEGNELKKVIKLLNDNGIEVFLDVVFNHTAEGNEHGPCFSFKGVDNNIYYLLTPEGYYYNFSGCGNTLNCNHPIVQQMIIECLRYWVTAYRVDGFRFDLASILGRNEDGSPMSKPPLLQSLAFDAILGDVKLIAEAWDAGGLYQVGSFPSWNRWAEWNGKYRDDIRSFLKGDDHKKYDAARRIGGSLDLYGGAGRGHHASVNFMTCHDGFTLYDLYSYNEKHNEKNGWDNTDGDNHNLSWNCGEEGETNREDVKALRLKMIKNACATLMCSRGVPMFLAGDEFGNTQFGNNNAYCQDTKISWLDWNLLEKNKEIFEFFKKMIAFRRSHDILRDDTAVCSLGFPMISVHSKEPWQENSNDGHYLGMMFAGRTKDNRNDDVIYIAFNMHWEEAQVRLPNIHNYNSWREVVNTDNERRINAIIMQECVVVPPRTVIIYQLNY
ncbi:MAG: glycogen debranching protein GlgX [Eubacteriales bacterium]